MFEMVVKFRYAILLCVLWPLDRQGALSEEGAYRKGSRLGGGVKFLPSRLSVCQAGHSQFSLGKFGEKNFLLVSILDTTAKYI